MTRQIFLRCERRTCGATSRRGDERGPEPRGALLKLRHRCCTTSPSPDPTTEDGRLSDSSAMPTPGGWPRDIMRRSVLAREAVRSLLVAEHLRPVQLARVGEVPTRRALYRFYRDLAMRRCGAPARAR